MANLKSFWELCKEIGEKFPADAWNRQRMNMDGVIIDSTHVNLHIIVLLSRKTRITSLVKIHFSSISSISFQFLLYLCTIQWLKNDNLLFQNRGRFMSKSIFAGGSIRTSFVYIIYEELMKRQFVTYAGVLSKYLDNSKLDFNKVVLGEGRGYGQLRKAFPEVVQAIERPSVW